MVETSPLLDSYRSWKSSFGQEVTFAFIEPSHQSVWRVRADSHVSGHRIRPIIQLTLNQH